MSIERTLYCNGPANPNAPHPDGEDRCPCNVSGPAQQEANHFIVVNWSGEELHFCTWDCLLRYGARIEPTEYIGAA